MIRIGLIGSKGRMGLAFAEYAAGVTDFEVCGSIDAGDNLQDLIEKSPDVILDLSLGAAVAVNGPVIAEATIPYIIGASAVPEEALGQIGMIAEQQGGRILLVPNFSIGATLMMHFAAVAAKYMHSPVVTERHHDRKADAPSGTAIHTADKINDAIGEGIAIREYTEMIPGVLGGRMGDVAIHSVRGTGYLAEQAVQFSLSGETLSVEHRSIDRGGFMVGIEYAIRNISKVNGLQVGLDSILDI